MNSFLSTDTCGFVLVAQVYILDNCQNLGNPVYTTPSLLLSLYVHVFVSLSFSYSTKSSNLFPFSFLFFFPLLWYNSEFLFCWFRGFLYCCWVAFGIWCNACWGIFLYYFFFFFLVLFCWILDSLLWLGRLLKYKTIVDPSFNSLSFWENW